MPRVTLQFNGREDWTDNGGCFGFTGRSSSVRFDNCDITNYRYDLRHAWGTTPQVHHGLDNNPKDLWTMLATNSPWSKYVTRLNNMNQDNNWSVEVDIKTDIPGHAVIGTASVFRFVKYMAANIGLGLLIYNKAVECKAHPMIAFLVASLAYSLKSPLVGGIMNNYGTIQSTLNLGDDIPFQLDRIDINDLYSLIENTWEFKEDDGDNFGLYKDTGRYNQDILNSYATGRFDFPQYVANRFFPLNPVVTREVQQNGGMGSRRSNGRERVAQNIRTIEPMALIGVALQLSSEFKRHGNFAGVTRFGDNRNGV